LSVEHTPPPGEQISGTPPSGAVAAPTLANGHGPSPLAHHFRDMRQQNEAAALGMWVFLATEVLFFGGVFTGYTVYRSTYYPVEFAAASRLLSVPLATTNTAVLLCSSLTMALAVYFARGGRKDALRICIGATMALGAAFLCIKFVEYYLDYREHLIPGYDFHPERWPEDLNVRHGELFMTFYFFMTMLHALHMVIGLGVMTVLLVRAARYAGANYGPVEAAGLYWHFVDIVWVFLFPLLYLVR
jgi:cytochrome c oxidase subunit 3